MSKTEKLVYCFPTQYTKTDKVKTNAGNRKIVCYKMKVLEDGRIALRKEDRTIDGYAQIQSYKDSCDINYILARFARGDMSALSKIQGVYGDFTETPKTLAELSQRVIDAENIFYQLPLETRQKFNHSPSEFYASIGTEKYNQALGIKPEELLQPSGSAPAVPDGTSNVVEGGLASE